MSANDGSDATSAPAATTPTTGAGKLEDIAKDVDKAFQDVSDAKEVLDVAVAAAASKQQAFDDLHADFEAKLQLLIAAATAEK